MANRESTPSQHSPMLKPKILETDELLFNFKEFPFEEETKETDKSEIEKCVIQSFDLGKEI